MRQNDQMGMCLRENSCLLLHALHLFEKRPPWNHVGIFSYTLTVTLTLSIFLLVLKSWKDSQMHMVLVSEANLVLRLKVTERVNLEISEFFVSEVIYFSESEVCSRGGKFL